MNTNKVQVLNKSRILFPIGQNHLERLISAVLKHLQYGRLTVSFPSGNVGTWSGSKNSNGTEAFHAVWRLNSYKSLKRMLQSRSVGFAEGYIEQEWDSPDLRQFLELMARNMDALEAQINCWSPVRLWHRIQHILRSNTRSGSKKNIAYHYDLGNQFYKHWLDPGMTYSSALFDDQHTDLVAAQINKYRQLAETLGIEKQHKVLEIGCGWGGFAEFAARTYGCRVTCVTLSREQLQYARERIECAGLSGLVDISFQDYRDIDGSFDRIVSIEMFEAVGEEHWQTYFKKLHDRLCQGGRIGLQVITIENNRFENYKKDTDFIQKYIFPGGMLPSKMRLHEEIRRAGFILNSERMFGESYALTLKIWRDEFLRNWSSISAIGYSERFRRMWEYYLSYCEVGFRRKTIDVGQFVIEKRAPVELERCHA